MPRPSLAACLALLTLAGCAAHAPAPRPSASLEADLARMPASLDAPATLGRARLLRALGRQDEAMASFEAAADHARERLDWAAMTHLWRATGDTYLELGRPQDALLAFQKRLETAVALEDTSERARALVDTAYALALMGATSRADEAAAEARLLAGDDLVRDPLTAEHLALTHERLRDAERASDLFAVAARGYEAAGDPASAARSLIYRAQMAQQASPDPSVFAGLSARVAAIADPGPRARLLRAQADAAYAQGDTAACEAFAKESVTLADARGLATIQKLARVVLARCAGDLEHLDLAIRSAEDAAALVEAQRSHLTGEQARQEAGFEAFQIYRLLLSLEVKLPEDERAARAFVTTERARARAHLDAVARSEARLSPIVPSAFSSPVLRASQEEAEDAVRRLTQALATSRREPGIAERHRDALWALADVQEAIRTESPLLARITVPAPATIDDARRALLDDESVLLSYFVAERQVILIAVTTKGERLAVLKQTPDELARDVRAFRRDVLLDPSASAGAVKKVGARLHEALLGPAAAELASHRKVLVLPHGPLASLPFEALVGRDGRFVVETHDVTYGLSATLGVELARRARPEGKRLAFAGLGDPVYDFAAFERGRKEEGDAAASRGLSLWTSAGAGAGASASASAPQGMGLERLPGTAAELAQIAKLFGADQRIYLRAQASEETMKSGAVAHARIVHIASHGILEPHYQALALTLNPASKEDGFLLTGELAGLSLDADLVVLSACQTGSTHMRAGEPVAGLALALRSAGARRVVVSLWSVDDDATARLMVDFYRPLVKEGASIEASLSAAKRAMIAKGPSHPYYWAPFILLGG